MQAPHVVIAVSDTGPGIAPHVQEHLFEPRVTTKTAGQRNGLGLWQTFKIVERHGGAIRYRTTPGEGTTFTIHLPVTQSSANAFGADR